MRQPEIPVFSLDQFEGPLDLLLYLVQRAELSIEAIPLRSITRQYLEQLEPETENIVDQGAEVCATTASLLLCKSRALLPPLVDVDEEEESPDPQFELLDQIVDYCRFRDRAKQLLDHEWNQAERFTRPEQPLPANDQPTTSLLSLEELASALDRVLQRAASRTQVITEEPLRFIDALRQIRMRLEGIEQIPFDELFSEASRDEVIVLFLAVLEMLKSEELALNQTAQHVITIHRSDRYNRPES